MYDIVVKKFTFAIPSSDEFLYEVGNKSCNIGYVGLVLRYAETCGNEIIISICVFIV